MNPRTSNKKHGMPRFDLQGKTAFVTGSGSGIGRATAEVLALSGALVFCSDRSASAAGETANRIVELGGRAEPVALDVVSRGHVCDAVEKAASDAGRLDIMCNIAGVAGDLSSVQDLDEASFDQIFQVHFKGVLFGCQAALSQMIPVGRGSIVNMASSAIDIAPARTVSYSVSKAAISMLTRTLANEVAHLGVRANTVAPGFVPTPLSLDTHDGSEQDVANYVNQWAHRSPMHRVGTAEDIADQILYLASDASSFVTGQTLRANGGATTPP